jgi:branched-chain amino acid transport system substrate-binding protein
MPNVRRRPRAILAILVLLALVTAACGSRLSDEERALALRTGSGVDASGVPAPTVEVDDLDDVDVAADGLPAGPTTAAPAPTGGDGGDASQDAAPADEGGGAPEGGGEAAGACVPQGEGGPGVSAEEIRLGNVSTISGPVPGFGRTGVNGARAYLNMVNAQGGVCGRQLTLVTADDRLQAAVNRSETEKLADQVLAFVGNTTVVDDGGAPIIDANQIPDVALAIADARISSPYNFSPNPIDLTPGVGNGAHRILAHYKQQHGIETAAIIYPAQASARGRALAYRDDFARAGIEVIHEFEVAITETNFSSQVNAMANSGVDVVITALEVNGMARLANEFEQRGYFPEVPFYGAQAYGRLFLQLAGSAGEGTRIGVAYAIPESADHNPAMAAFNEWYARSNPGQDVDFFAIMGWISADMLVRSIREAGPAPDRANVLARLQTLTDYDGDGLVGSIDPANKGPARCFATLEVRDGGWVQTFPDRGFSC